MYCYVASNDLSYKQCNRDAERNGPQPDVKCVWIQLRSLEQLEARTKEGLFCQVLEAEVLLYWCRV
jgi:hypothetical protein